MRNRIDARACLWLAAALLAGCESPPLDAHPGCPLPPSVRPRGATALTLRDKVDVLFMIDNSNGAAPLWEVSNRFQRFIKPLQEFGRGIDLHIGLVSSDYGAGATGAPGCSPSGLEGGGDQGKLIGIGKKADVTCQKPKGANYIEYEFGAQPVHNLPGNQGLLETFACMSDIGAQGCGFEHPLESVYAALHNNIVENQGFLRDDALLLVLFITNEDDASAPHDTDLFDKNKVADYGYTSSYSRQTRFGVVCGDPPELPPYGDSQGPLLNCRPAPNPGGAGPGKLFDVQRYIDFFTLPRAMDGVKDSSDDVILVGVDAPETPFQVILSNPGTPGGQTYIPCGRLSESSNPPCVPVLQHSCINPMNMNFYGTPAVRLNAVIRSVRQHDITSVCADDYGGAFERAARLVLDRFDHRCIEGTLPRDESCQPIIDCNVKDITLHDDGSETRVPLPRCEPGGSLPCWRAALRSDCAGWPDGIGVNIERGMTGGVPNAPPPHTSSSIECATTP